MLAYVIAPSVFGTSGYADACANTPLHTQMPQIYTSDLTKSELCHIQYFVISSFSRPLSTSLSDSTHRVFLPFSLYHTRLGVRRSRFRRPAALS